MNDAVDEYLSRFQTLGLDGRPATERQVKQLEQKVAATLPASYRAYLLIAGRRPPKAWVGSDCTMRHLPDLRAWAEELLRENGQPPLPPHAFVFLMHQGYQFFFFDADNRTEDPPVFYYLEGEPAVVKRFERFSELVSTCTGDGNAAGA